MPVTLRGSSWQAQVNHKMQRYRRNFPSKPEAQAWEAESKARLLRGEAPDMGDSARVDRLASTMKLQDDRDFVPHILRHEFCSRLADRGLNAAVIKELAGHSSLVVTQRYIRVGAQALVDAIAALERAEAPQNPAWQAGRGETPEFNA